MSKTKLEAPLSMIENYMEYIIQDLKQRNPELDEEQAKKEHEGTANKNVKWYLIKLELIKTNKISVSNKELDEKIEEFINQNEAQKKEIKEFYGKDENLNNLYEQVLNDKLLKQINEFAINKISEKSTSELRKEK